jgi:toxin ParE1/3/4
LKFHEEATAEYLASLSWYAERSESTAIEFQNAVETTVRRIVAAPESFPSFDDGSRFVIVDRFPFSIIYEQLEDAIQVVAVAHTSRRPGYWRYRR